MWLRATPSLVAKAESDLQDRAYRNRMFGTLIAIVFMWVIIFTQIVYVSRVNFCSASYSDPTFRSASKQAEYAGICCNIMNLIMLMAPLSKTREVFRTHSARYAISFCRIVVN